MGQTFHQPRAAKESNFEYGRQTLALVRPCVYRKVKSKMLVNQNILLLFVFEETNIFLCIYFIFRRTMNDVTDDKTKDCTAQLVTDKDLLTIFSNILCYYGCFNQSKSRFTNEPFKKELKKLFQKEKDFSTRCSGSLNESMYIAKFTEQKEKRLPDLDVLIIADTMYVSDENNEKYIPRKHVLEF